MKKRIIRVAIIVISLLLLVGVSRAAILYFGNMNPNKEHFGDKYIQVIYPTSISDYLTAKDVIKEAEKSLSTITTDDQAEQKFGQLGRLCITDDKAVSETHDLDFIAANFSGDDGYMWVKYSSQAYDKNGENTYGSLDVLSRWELKKIKDEWTVISIDEHP